MHSKKGYFHGESIGGQFSAALPRLQGLIFDVRGFKFSGRNSWLRPAADRSAGGGVNLEHKRWMETSDVVSMFPCLVWKFQLEANLRDSLNAGIGAALADLRRELPPLEAGRGWQSEPMLHRRDELRELVSCIDRGVTSILRFLRIGHDTFEITGCWATILARDAAHKAHSHPNNLLSGVYYVRADSGADRINFHDPRRQAAVIRPPVVELTAANTDQVVVRVSSGTLLIFPSWLEHSVDANPNETERISVSFNVMLSGFTERLSQPLWSGGRSS